ncbi:MAG: hypothetical protein U5N58_10730 [Actinomycetota bacterium]|nr:hypothetical protein [Actinomycetota bacterium]
MNETIVYLRDVATKINIFGASQRNVKVGINLEQVYKILDKT